MPRRNKSQQRQNVGYAPPNFLRAAFCPLDFQAMLLSDHAEYVRFKRDKALKTLIVGQPLHYTTSLRYKDIPKIE